MEDMDRLVRAINELTREVCKLKEQVRDLNHISRERLYIEHDCKVTSEVYEAIAKLHENIIPGSMKEESNVN